MQHYPKGLAFLVQGTAARNVTDTTTAGATGFSLQAMLYVGPARLFTYDNVQYRVEVKVRHQANVAIPGLIHWAGHALADGVAGGFGQMARGLPAADQARLEPT